MRRRRVKRMSAVSLREATAWCSSRLATTVLLFPWAVVAKGLGTGAILAVAVFLGVLVLGLAYAWKKGALQWK